MDALWPRYYLNTYTLIKSQIYSLNTTTKNHYEDLGKKPLPLSGWNMDYHHETSLAVKIWPTYVQSIFSHCTAQVSNGEHHFTCGSLLVLLLLLLRYLLLPGVLLA